MRDKKNHSKYDELKRIEATFRLKREGTPLLRSLFDRFEYNRLGINTILLGVELLTITLIIFCRDIDLLFSSLFFLLGFLGFIHLLIFFLYENVTVQQEIYDTFPIHYLAYKKGLENLPPVVIYIKGRIGKRAEKIKNRAKLSENEESAFHSLLDEWSGSYKELLETVKHI